MACATVVENQSNDDYHSDLSAVSKTMVSIYDDDPSGYYDQFVGPQARHEPRQEDFLDLGSYVDALLFEPSRISQFVEIPKHALTSNGQRRGNAWDEFVLENKGRTVMQQADLKVGNEMARRLRHVAKDYLSPPGYCQLSIYYTCPLTGLRCRCRPDKLIVLPDGSRSIIYDLKTTANLDRFRWVFRDFKYWLQEVHYRTGVRELLGQEPDEFVFGVIETSERHRYQEVRMDAKSLDNSYRKRDQLMRDLESSYKTGDWGTRGVLRPATVSVYM